MKTNHLKLVLGLGALILIPFLAQADNSPAQKPEARSMLGNPVETGPVEKKMTKADFEWAALTKNKAANGAVPIVGPGSGKPFYDFRDGLPHPFYIVPRR